MNSFFSLEALPTDEIQIEFLRYSREEMYYNIYKKAYDELKQFEKQNKKHYTDIHHSLTNLKQTLKEISTRRKKIKIRINQLQLQYKV